MRILSVVIGASRTQITTQNIYASTLVVRSTGADYLGDDTVTSSNGIPLSATPLVIPCAAPRGILLSSLYVSGAQGDTVNFLYEPSA